MSRKRNYKKNKNRMLKIKEILNKKEYPDICLITGLEKLGKIDGEICYFNDCYTPYYVFGYPEFDEKEQAFCRNFYDLDEVYYEGTEIFCDINDVILHHKNWEKIKKHYRLKVKYNKRGQICKVKQLKY